MPHKKTYYLIKKKEKKTFSKESIFDFFKYIKALQLFAFDMNTKKKS